MVSFPFRLGLTGGIGCGKSTVSQFFFQWGAQVIDADAISRELTAAGGSAISLIAHTFGSSFIDANGALIRDDMRSLVYADATARAALEAIVHPLVAQAIELRTQSAILQNSRMIIFDVPLLVESPRWRQKVDHLLVVDSTHDVQVARVIERNAFAVEQIEKIIASQVSRSRRLNAADTVISNSALSLNQLEREVNYLAKRFGLSCS